MITITVPFDNPLNQKTYENLINTLQFHQLQCTCGHSGCLTIHGYYTRSLKEDDSEITLSICRVKCSHRSTPCQHCGASGAVPLLYGFRCCKGAERIRGTLSFLIQKHKPSAPCRVWYCHIHGRTVPVLPGWTHGGYAAFYSVSILAAEGRPSGRVCGGTR